MAVPFQFIDVSTPTKLSSSTSRKTKHAHVMRHVHAKKRVLQTQRFQNERMKNDAKQDLRTLQLSLPSPLRQVGSPTKDPFASISRPLSSEEYSLLTHYLHVILPFNLGHCSVFESPGDHHGQVLREWIGLAITDDALMASAVLLSTCRYILVNQPENPIFTRMVLQYKRTCLRTIQGEIRRKNLTAMTAAKAIALAMDEVIYGEHSVARKHIEGVLAMIEFSGSPESLGLTGLLARMYNKFLIVLGIGTQKQCLYSRE